LTRAHGDSVADESQSLRAAIERGASELIEARMGPSAQPCLHVELEWAHLMPIPRVPEMTRLFFTQSKSSGNRKNAGRRALTDDFPAQPRPRNTV
jgi:hypothetical protein